MDTLNVTTMPAKLDTNFEVIKVQLAKDLLDFDEVVTADTVASAKKRATELNKMSTDLKSRMKTAVDEVSAPILEFKNKGKELDTMIQDTRQRILVQVQAFEDKTLAEIRVALSVCLAANYEALSIRDEFRTAETESLVKLGAFTPAGKLAKSASDTVMAKAQQCQVIQQRTDLRISQLENESHRAGLHSPLTREHIAGFLFTDNQEVYNNNLAQLIARELDRQKETLERAEKIRLDDEAKLVSAATVAPAPITEPESAQHQEEPTAPAAQAAPVIQSVEQVVAKPVGPTRRVEVSIMLNVDAPVAAPLAAIEAALRKKLVAAGIEQSIHSIFTTEAAQQGAV